MSTMHRPSSMKTPTTLLPGGILPHLLLLCSVTATFPALAQAADFAGDLDQVKITDAAGTNQPPVATFTFTQNAETYTFDASGSTDPDGSIATYKWTYPDGTTAEGATATFTTAETAKFPVTLTVVDNNGGAALNQQQVIPTVKGIADDFTTDTTADYIVLSGKTLSVHDGGLYSAEVWSTTVAYHKTTLEGQDQSIKANVDYNEQGYSGLLLRCTPSAKTGYTIYFDSGRVNLNKYSNGELSWLAFYDGSYSYGKYLLEANVKGNLINIYVNGQLAISKTDDTYLTGSNVGVIIRAKTNLSAISIRDLVAE